ncbi:endopeptidase La [Myroides marinus]|uniref:endopeptidase La n=1 Tax=Myroides marinus TaxID=703342 RepID=UPI002575BB70|nr:endopeptidase La [Myroides marinus]MDM1361522.1 endopeptidase La [Myroides marinus]MDM1373344.1 endopeptidase La [Myroides marinus]MDM1376911.1 endopeptidase La [Myroides marinus]MDM1380772.1 endopeptidase La [Myroides marinus]MDM1384293.1 endopeptidase La [Myroides marinus]
MANQKLITFDNLSLQDLGDGDSEFIPIFSSEDEEEMNNEELPTVLPILPLRNMVLFPGVVIPITAGRDKSIELLNKANKGDKTIGVVAQIDESTDDPGINEIYRIGTVARIIKLLKLPDGNITVILQGKKRFEITELVQEEPFMKANVIPRIEKRPGKKNKEFPAIVDSIKETALEIIKENPNIPSDAAFAIENINSDSFLINFVSSNMSMDIADKQRLLNIDDLNARGLEALKMMTVELQKLQLRNDIQTKVRIDLDQQQKEYFLHQQMKTIQEELGGFSNEEEFEEMRKKATTKKWSKTVKERFDKELMKFQRMNPQVAEFGIQRNYLELLLELPWNHYSKDVFNLKNAQKQLDKDHYGIEDVKKRVLEHMAVLKLRNDLKSPILCLYGPPGVGKTSIGRSIADALGREYVRISLGGLRDEAEIRGHRKTYIGAMPGRIIQSLKKAKTSNPVFLLDEIDKLSSSHNGDPSSALLEVLDPEQNHEFYDNFLEMGYDLSKVMFIATSNSLSTIQPALRDRMEIIEMTGYTIEEKVEIGRQHLLAKQLTAHGLTSKDVVVGKKQMEFIITNYTRESGVRGLDKQLAHIARGVAKSIVMEEEYNVKMTEEDIKKILGTPRFENDKYENNDVAGVVTGLAWTSVGGDILYIESIISKGKGELSITGNLGTVMKESATIALEYIKAHADELGIAQEVFDNYKIHIHVPEGATPKDGPSAGITMLTSMVSSFTQRKVKKNLAMTGEITLRGKVLPVGGIKEKILAAKRANIKEIILCKDNRKDIEDIKEEYLKGLTFHYVDRMEEVLELAITDQKVKNAKKFDVAKK